MSLDDSRIECVRSCLAIVSMLTVRVVVLYYSQLHKRLRTSEFGGFENVLRDAGIRAIPI